MYHIEIRQPSVLYLHNPKISNLSGVPKHIAYNIAFFDRSGNLIARSSSNTDIDTNEKDLFAESGMPAIPRSQLEKSVHIKR